MLPPYAELHCVTNFTFLRGASHAEELVARAKALGYAALAVTDECSLAGVVRAHLEAKAVGLPLIIGAEFSLRDAFGDPHARLVLLAQTRQGYGNLSELITRARRRAAKGSYTLLREDLANGVEDCIALLVPSPAVAFDPPDAMHGVLRETAATAVPDTSFDASRNAALHASPDALASLLDQTRLLRERFPAPSPGDEAA